MSTITALCICHREPSQKIAILTGTLEELRSEKEILLNLFECAYDTGLSAVWKHADAMEADLQMLERHGRNMASS